MLKALTFTVSDDKISMILWLRDIKTLTGMFSLQLWNAFILNTHDKRNGMLTFLESSLCPWCLCLCSKSWCVWERLSEVWTELDGQRWLWDLNSDDSPYSHSHWPWQHWHSSCLICNHFNAHRKSRIQEYNETSLSSSLTMSKFG